MNNLKFYRDRERERERERENDPVCMQIISLFRIGEKITEKKTPVNLNDISKTRIPYHTKEMK